MFQIIPTKTNKVLGLGLTLSLVVSAFVGLELKTAAPAEAADPIISIVDGSGAVVSTVISPPSVAWTGGSGGATTVAGPGDPRRQYQFYPCSSLSGSTCVINDVKVQDTRIYEQTCSWGLTKDGVTVRYGGANSVTYLRSAMAPTWNWFNKEEKMFDHLTQIGWWASQGSIVNGGATSEEPFKSARYQATTDPYTIGSLSWKCIPQYTLALTSYREETKMCAPKTDGRLYPYSVGIGVTLYNNNIDRVGSYTNQDWQETSATCYYVSPSTPPKEVFYYETKYECYWGVSYSGGYSESRSSVKNGGAPTGIISFSDPSTMPYTTATTVENCSGVDLKANMELKEYAYYRLSGSYNFRSYLKTVYIFDTKWTAGAIRVSSTNITITENSLKSNGAGKTVSTYGVYSCSNVPDAYRNYTYAELPAQGTVIFNESACNQVQGKWSCVIPDSPKINATSNNVQLMRDGTFVPLTLPKVVVSGNVVRDTTTKQVGNLSGNNLSYKTNVVAGSSPFLGTDPNASKQYFELFNNAKNKETFNAWKVDPNNNINKNLSYYWSSDNGASWKMTYEARINTAEFNVPVKGSTDAPTTTGWRVDTNIACDVLKTSNTAIIVRSAGSK
jgi:hypothetical protein